MILCLSDIHLGSPICQAELTLKILEDCEYEKNKKPTIIGSVTVRIK
jgi:hypothetical protein